MSVLTLIIVAYIIYLMVKSDRKKAAVVREQANVIVVEDLIASRQASRELKEFYAREAEYEAYKASKGK